MKKSSLGEQLGTSDAEFVSFIEWCVVCPCQNPYSIWVAAWAADGLTVVVVQVFNH